MIDGLYADFLTKEFDFLDDARMYPHDEWFTADPMTYIGSGDWEDAGTTYRAWLYNRRSIENEYWSLRHARIPFQYQNFVQDPTVNGTSNALEMVRIVYPAPNGDFNVPYPNIKGSEQYSFNNSSYPLKHNMTRITLPVIDLAFQTSRASDLSTILENQNWINDAAPDTMHNREQAYRVARIDFMDTMASLIPNGGMAPDRVLSEEEAATLATSRAIVENYDSLTNNPNPWDDERYRFVWGDGTNPVEGAQNGTIHQWVGYGDGNNYMTNHPLGTMPFEVLPGVTMLNILPAVKNISLAPTVGNPGDMVKLLNDDFYAWDPQNQEWSKNFYYRFISPFVGRMNGLRDWKVSCKNELGSSMKPFAFASLHIPAFSLSTSNEIVK